MMACLRAFCWTMLALACAMTSSAAQPGATQPVPAFTHLPALAGSYFSVQSKSTGRSYHINVRLPDGYDKNPAARFPVVYVLDGDTLFPILAASHLFLTVDDKLPEAIVVGIAYGGLDPSVNKRSIDFMNPGAGIAPEAAGASSFQDFLKRELLPMVESRYRADPQRRILFGQSRSASFVLYSAFTDPDLFWGRIANNPALAPAKDFFYGAASPAVRKDLTLVVVNGTEDLPVLRANTVEWLADRQKRKADPWTLRSVTIQDGTHAASSPDAYRAGLRLLFGWSRK